ncbi:hypothetical protein FHG87_006328 [Trinorchestia longiramus]|nr:hypothetical protein FHG87_006328 [Trinorchestia longiramus]
MLNDTKRVIYNMIVMMMMMMIVVMMMVIVMMMILVMMKQVMMMRAVIIMIIKTTVSMIGPTMETYPNHQNDCRLRGAVQDCFDLVNP